MQEAASVAEYRELARAEIDRLRGAGVVPLLVGGSGLYVRAVLDELDFPAPIRELRARLEGELAAVGPARAARRLAALDPAAAAAVLPSNGRRIVRALEVLELTGRPFRAQLPEPRPHYPAVVVGLDREPAELDERVVQRVDRMWAAGFVARSRRWPPTACARSPTASRALGYAQVLAQLDGTLTGDGGPRAHGEHHPPVRPPAAVLVPPRSRRPLVRRRPPRPARRGRSAAQGPYDRAVTDPATPRVLLGHGTENDFVVLPDPDGTVWPEDRLDAALVRAALRPPRRPRR